MTFAPSPQQQTFLNWVRTGRGSAVMIAVAGAGKSSSIELALNEIPDYASVQLIAFNTTIASELKQRIEKIKTTTGRTMRGVRASTFHALGFGALRKRFGNRPVETTSKKCRNLCRGWLGEAQYEMYADFICKLVGLAKGEGIGVLKADQVEEWRDLVAHHDLFLESEDADEETAIGLARELLRRSNIAAKDGIIDFDDQLYLPLLWHLRLWQNDWVFVDEAQDTNPVRRALAKLALRPGGRLVAVGDPCQAIYGFTGASHDAIELIKREFTAIELPLTVSFRCAKAVVAQAKLIVPYIEAAESAPEGRVSSLTLKEAVGQLGAHDAILCRQTAPLIDLAFKLIGSGRGCIVLGKDIGAGLVNLINKMKAKGLPKLVEKLNAYRDREVEAALKKDDEHKADAIRDRVASIMSVVDRLHENERTVPALIAKIEGLFSDTNGVLTLATVHKAKGKEWDQVAVLRQDLMPSKWARQDWQLTQENNLIYVARTRAKRHLIYLLDEAL